MHDDSETLGRDVDVVANDVERVEYPGVPA